jgi:hypothetical protein
MLNGATGRLNVVSRRLEPVVTHTSVKTMRNVARRERPSGLAIAEWAACSTLCPRGSPVDIVFH